MTPKQALAVLKQYNAWRRGEDDSIKMPSPTDIGKAIDVAIRVLTNTNQ